MRDTLDQSSDILPCIAQDAHALALGVYDDHVVGVHLLLATVVPGLFFLVFGPLAAPFGPIEGQVQRLALLAFAQREVARIALGQYAYYPAVRAFRRKPVTLANSHSPSSGDPAGYQYRVRRRIAQPDA